jgi:hypothetical protein
VCRRWLNNHAHEIALQPLQDGFKVRSDTYHKG